MAAAWLEERPRPVSVPAPMPMARTAVGGGSAKAQREETIKALRDKLSEFQAENTLLGTLVKELKTERDVLQKKLSTTTKQHNEASSQAAAATAEADVLHKDQQHLRTEVDRLTSVLHSHSLRLQKAKQHQKELEDVALDLRAELDDCKAQQEVVQAAADAATHRATAAEAKLEAAGLGAMPKMGPTAEQLVINSTQRIRELSEELSSAKAQHARQLADLQQQLQAAQAAAQASQAQLEQQLREQGQQLASKAAKLLEAEAQAVQLSEQLVEAQRKVVQGQDRAQTQQELQLQQVRQGMLASSQCLQQQVDLLTTKLTDCEAAHTAALADQQRRLAAAQRERQELSAALVSARQQESAARLALGEAASKAERLRGELLRCVGELQSQLAAAADAGQQQQQALQQLRALEAMAAAARAEAAETRQQLVELATASLAELQQQVAGEAAAISGLPGGLDAAQLPAPVGSYIKVLEHAIVDCEQRCKQAAADALAAQQQERQAWSALAAAREAQAAAERGLQQQTQRLLAAERMRLADLKEQQSLERRLIMVQQEAWSLRDALANNALAAGSNGSNGSNDQHLALQLAWRQPNTAAAAADDSATGAAANRARVEQAADWCNAAGRAVGSSSNSPGRGAHATAQQQQQQELQCWQQVPAAADAGRLGAATAASTAATLSRYQAKLAQLRAMREQLSRGPIGRNNSSSSKGPDLGNAADNSTSCAGLGCSNSSRSRSSYQGSHLPGQMAPADPQQQQQRQQQGSGTGAYLKAAAAAVEPHAATGFAAAYVDHQTAAAEHCSTTEDATASSKPGAGAGAPAWRRRNSTSAGGAPLAAPATPRPAGSSDAGAGDGGQQGGRLSSRLASANAGAAGVLAAPSSYGVAGSGSVTLPVAGHGLSGRSHLQRWSQQSQRPEMQQQQEQVWWR